MGNTETNLRREEFNIDSAKGVVHDDWNVFPGMVRETPVTVFSAVHPLSSKKRPYMEKALQASKVYRHPGILRYVDGGVLGNEIFIVTEEASPLLVHGVENMSLLQITAGLSSITEALVFLHDKAGVSHNNVNASTIYITSDGLWKLWGFEYLCSFGDLTKGHIERIDQYCSEKNIPPDNQSRITPAYQHARDCYSYGKFLIDVISPVIDLEDLMVTEFMDFVQKRALHRNWNERPRLVTFSEHSLFQHDFHKLRHDLINILLQPPEQKDEFIRSLPNSLGRYSDDVVASTLSSQLLGHTFFLIPASASHLMPHLLKPKIGSDATGLFSVPIYKEFILPRVLQLFSTRDATIRKVLLAHFEHYVHLITKTKLTEFVLPELLLGIRDTDEELVSRTLRSLAHLVPILGANVVVGRNREQIFSTYKPKMRGNDGIRSISLKKNRKTKETSIPMNKSQDHAYWNSTLQDSSSDVLENLKLTPVCIPERSAPDGGEMDEVGMVNHNEMKTSDDTLSLSLDDHWSDWEEMLDQPPPDIVGVLEVKNSIDEGDDDVDFEEDKLRLPHHGIVQPVVTTSKIGIESTKQNPRHDKFPHSSKTSGMKLKVENASTKMKKNKNLGDEYDIMSIRITKKRDSELDMFAGLAPKLQTKDYNLESMLLEASLKIQDRVPSVSNPLAELDMVGMEMEGDDWNEDGNWSSSEEVFNQNS